MNPHTGTLSQNNEIFINVCLDKKSDFMVYLVLESEKILSGKAYKQRNEKNRQIR